jgi:hypothetical protein
MKARERAPMNCSERRPAAKIAHGALMWAAEKPTIMVELPRRDRILFTC